MKRYTGTKTLSAQPMTRGGYNAYRSGSMPANENPDDPGYLVEYEDGGKANDPRHAGYISWTPADVFERSYKPSETFQDRMRLEYAELSERLAKLLQFLRTEAFDALDHYDRERLHLQPQAMMSYEFILSDRIVASGGRRP